MPRLANAETIDFDTLAQAARIIRAFIEDYHERLEERHLFPRFRQAGELVGLVDVLERQHQAGRDVTDVTLRLTDSAGAAMAPEERQRLAESLQQFVRMYEPHEAREDTVLFPALRRVIKPEEWDDLGDRFEEEENTRFGQNGFEGVVEQVAELEKRWGCTT